MSWVKRGPTNLVRVVVLWHLAQCQRQFVKKWSIRMVGNNSTQLTYKSEEGEKITSMMLDPNCARRIVFFGMGKTFYCTLVKT